MMGTSARAALLGAAGAALTGVAAVWLLRTAATAWPGTGAVGVELGVGFLATGAAGLLAAWVAVVLGSASVSLALSARPAGDRPDGVDDGRRPRGGLTGRVATVLLVVAGLGAGPATAAEAPLPVGVTAQVDPAVLAAAPELRTAGAVPATVEDVHDPGAGGVPVPGWTPTTARPAPARQSTAQVGLVSTTAAPTSTDEVVVHRGDTLWDIAARHLGEHATDQDVAEAWPRWYAANRDVIGADPDLIHPGQRLVVPAPGGAR